MRKHTNIDTLFDSGSQTNWILAKIFKYLGLETKSHPKPYTLWRVCDNEQLEVTKKCRLRFAITFGFLDEVDLDVVPLEICGIVLGSPYIFDKKEMF